MQGEIWIKNCFSQETEDEEKQLLCTICNIRCVKLDSIISTQQLHIESQSHIAQVQRLALSQVNTAYDETTKQKEQFEQRHDVDGNTKVINQIHLFDYNKAKIIYNKSQCLNEYFNEIIKGELNTSQKQFQQGSIKTYLSVIKKFYYLTFYEGVDVYQSKVLEVFVMKATHQQISILKIFLIENLIKPNLDLNSTDKKRLINFMENRFLELLEIKLSPQNFNNYFLQFINELQLINQDKLGLALLIMFYMKKTREEVYQMQFQQLHQFENELTNQNSLEQSKIREIYSLIIQESQKILTKLKLQPNAYIYRFKKREAQSNLKDSKADVILRLLNEYHDKNKLELISFIDDIYFNSISKLSKANSEEVQVQNLEQQKETKEPSIKKKINKSSTKSLIICEQVQEFNQTKQDRNLRIVQLETLQIRILETAQSNIKVLNKHIQDNDNQQIKEFEKYMIQNNMNPLQNNSDQVPEDSKLIVKKKINMLQEEQQL